MTDGPVVAALRSARPGDELEVGGVHVRSWQVGYDGILPAEFLDGLNPVSEARRYTFAEADETISWTTVAILQGNIVGFSTITSEPEEYRTGVLNSLYVDPAHWRHGIGALLMVDARRRMIRRGYTSATLWVLTANARAIAFYQADRWLLDGEKRRAEVHGLQVDQLRMRRPDLS